MTPSQTTCFIRQQAALLGFDACGFAKAKNLPETEAEHLKLWLKNGYNGDMTYMSNHLEKRLDPTLLNEGCKSVVVVALNYYPSSERSEFPKIARFAYGDDYHDLIRNKLRLLMQRIQEEGIPVRGRAFADSAPIAERYWAAQAGLGWIGKNRQLILPGKGSYFLLGVLLIDLELEYGKPIAGRCGSCNRCKEFCPTTALGEDGLDSRKCLSYLTIEKKGAFSMEEKKQMSQNKWVFGCDICQEVCPWNRFAAPHQTPAFSPSKEFIELNTHDFKHLIPEDFDRLFGHSCLKRTGMEGLKRNIEAIQEIRPND